MLDERQIIPTAQVNTKKTIRSHSRTLQETFAGIRSVANNIIEEFVRNRKRTLASCCCAIS